MTVSINIQAYIYNPYGPTPPATDTLLTSMILKVESPTINSYVVSSSVGASQAAPPLWFGPTSGDPPAPNPLGPEMTFMLDPTLPNTPGRVGFWANITNNTHYDLVMGFIQIIDFNLKAIYTNGVTRSALGVDDLDTLPVLSTYWYRDYQARVGAGVTGSIPNLSDLPTDAPRSAVPATNGGYLQQHSFHAEFQTHLAVGGGWLAGSTTAVPGYPVGLSTAKWHLDGYAENWGNMTNPTGGTAANTFNMANWTIQLASGAGSSPTSLPAANGPWIASGDGIPKYLSWDGEAFTDLGKFTDNVELSSSPYIPQVGPPGLDFELSRQTLGLGPFFIATADMTLLELVSIPKRSLRVQKVRPINPQ